MLIINLLAWSNCLCCVTKDRKLRRGDEDFLTLLTPHMMPTPPVAPSPREKGGNHRRQRKVSDESKQLHDSLVGSPYSMSPAPNGRY